MVQSYHISGPSTGRVTINRDGSLLLKKVTKRDAGIYTVAVEKENSQTLIGYVKLSVYRHVRKPTLRISNTTATEDKDAVVFTCYSNAHTIQWLFNGTELQPTERMKLSQDHRSLTIDPVKREDAGNYQCEASNPISSVASVALELNVKFE
ncbi:carcinoembryonic antigen-related cell adhesion molecule 21-like [Phyllostomus discolor]|uniref:Carcinoembryonic antigen-related cell adhesion molecule 21-like n=1 Tax=Phyllostomus discolor TaxID=89673 RepID=A0A7E6CRE3_9CHIR|nr:carcinoembryonic antigen-related cell adhesion molecule 21-like [Phyllostomus discolor]